MSDRRMEQSHGTFIWPTSMGWLQTAVLAFVATTAIEGGLQYFGSSGQEAGEWLGFTDTQFEKTTKTYVTDTVTTTQVEKVSFSREAQVAAIFGASTGVLIALRYVVPALWRKFKTRSN